MVKLKLKINVNLLQLLCVVVSVALHCEFARQTCLLLITYIITHQTHYEKSDWSRAFNQFTIACELDMINAISAANIAFIMSSSTSAWLLSPWSVLLRNKMAEHVASVSEDKLCEKCIIKQLLNSVFV